MVAGSVKGKRIAVVAHPQVVETCRPNSGRKRHWRGWGTPERVLEASQVGASGSVWPSEAATVLLSARTY